MDRNRSQINWAYMLRHGLALVPLAFLLVFFFYPLLSIFALSLAPDGQLDLSSFGQIVTTAYYRNTLWFTLWQAVLSTFLTIVLALPGAYVFARYQFPGKSVFLSLATLSFVLPTIVVAAAFTALIGPRGLLNTLLMTWFSLESPLITLDRSLTLILIAHIFYNYALALRLMSSYWANLNPRIEEAARVLGARGWSLWWHVRLPMLFPAISGAALLIFIFTFTSFGVVLVLGGPRFATLEVEIYNQARNVFNLPVAAALSLLQIVVMFAMMSIYTRLQRRISVETVSAQQTARRPQNTRQWLFVFANLLFMAVLLLLPLFALVVRSFTGEDGFTTQFYVELTRNARNSVLFVPPLEAVGNSVVFALATTVLSLILGLMIAVVLSRRDSPLANWLDPLFMLPLATSAVTLGFGYLIALDKPPVNLRASPLLIPLAHTLVAMPFVVRSVLPVLRGIKPSVQEAAQVLGAPPWRVWWLIDLPLISRGLIVGATFAFTVSMGEFGASLFVARPDTPTMPVVIFRLLGQPGGINYGQAMAMSSLLMMVSAVAFLLIERLRSAGVREF